MEKVLNEINAMERKVVSNFKNTLNSIKTKSDFIKFEKKMFDETKKLNTLSKEVKKTMSIINIKEFTKSFTELVKTSKKDFDSKIRNIIKNNMIAVKESIIMDKNINEDSTLAVKSVDVDKIIEKNSVLNGTIDILKFLSFGLIDYSNLNEIQALNMTMKNFIVNKQGYLEESIMDIFENMRESFFSNMTAFYSFLVSHFEHMKQSMLNVSIYLRFLLFLLLIIFSSLLIFFFTDDSSIKNRIKTTYQQIKLILTNLIKRFKKYVYWDFEDNGDYKILSLIKGLSERVIASMIIIYFIMISVQYSISLIVTLVAKLTGFNIFNIAIFGKAGFDFYKVYEILMVLNKYIFVALYKIFVIFFIRDVLKYLMDNNLMGKIFEKTYTLFGRAMKYVNNAMMTLINKMKRWFGPEETTQTNEGDLDKILDQFEKIAEETEEEIKREKKKEKIIPVKIPEAPNTNNRQASEDTIADDDLVNIFHMYLKMQNKDRYFQKFFIKAIR